MNRQQNATMSRRVLSAASAGYTLVEMLVVLTITFAQPRIGATATIGILIAGQLVMGAVIDRYGLFGVDQIAITWPRLLGVGLLGAGAALSLSK